jgi:hypothetical protein
MRMLRQCSRYFGSSRPNTHCSVRRYLASLLINWRLDSTRNGCCVRKGRELRLRTFTVSPSVDMVPNVRDCSRRRGRARLSQFPCESACDQCILRSHHARNIWTLARCADLGDVANDFNDPARSLRKRNSRHERYFV